ncbi:MAG: hypothetical protein A3F84_02150 [Candidatus Handelsmanbacteria bacterium RIFCSPLOWO2_12_FULL_64_10]|uniref:Uncharacterized protein n=1 Tax=Handelsmanbacteria sp. (strain RIFCSPLOWO2_12_FULL_64_10) TaxID=1817868 RepID=A0A1F6D777_HANXR|nr:MAG: hypothetical protein A3F84_02150 [Candidatus Handelsmanbacteria bacterium RIFCSPLOWO2_12_FULL_64_10]
MRRNALSVETPAPPPAWALLERELIRAQTLACQEFFDRYFDERGYLMCVPRWGGDDGPDDAAENLLNWTVLHALGAPDTILTLYKKGWEGHLRQYTEAKTVEVPFARDGMYYKEFPVMFDWFHHGEGFSAFFLQGLSDPDDLLFRARSRRYAGLYLNEDPQAPNYDPKHRIIRSMFNGSRGPLLRKATALDWAGDPIEVEGRFRLGHSERSFQEMLDHFKDYTDVVGDHPINLGATTLTFNAYALTGEDRYRDWLLGYVDAWAERTAANQGIIPSNIGLDGAIGGACGGKWYGGCYGWGFTVIVPQTGERAHRPAVYSRAHYGFANALLLTGDRRYLDVWRGVLDRVNANARQIDGRTMYPRMFGDDGWYDYRPQPFGAGALELYYWSMDPADRRRLEGDNWIEFLEGQRPDYPVQALQGDMETIRRRVARMRADASAPDTRLSDDMNPMNPVVTETLIRLMLGGLPTGRIGFPLHCRVRYFDPARRRAGIPEDVAALVEKLTDDETTLALVNVSPTQAREVLVQGGAYAEHQILSASMDGQTLSVNDPCFTVRLAPGAGGRIALRMKRYANQPTLAFPWDRA